MEMRQLIERSHLDPRMVSAWIEADWLLPATARTVVDFSEADLARALLIQELKPDFGVNDEGVAIVLHLLDQLYGLRPLSRRSAHRRSAETTADFNRSFKTG